MINRSLDENFYSNILAFENANEEEKVDLRHQIDEVLSEIFKSPELLDSVTKDIFWNMYSEEPFVQEIKKEVVLFLYYKKYFVDNGSYIQKAYNDTFKLDHLKGMLSQLQSDEFQTTLFKSKVLLQPIKELVKKYIYANIKDTNTDNIKPIFQETANNIEAVFQEIEASPLIFERLDSLCKNYALSCEKKDAEKEKQYAEVILKELSAIPFAFENLISQVKNSLSFLYGTPVKEKADAILNNKKKKRELIDELKTKLNSYNKNKYISSITTFLDDKEYEILMSQDVYEGVERCVYNFTSSIPEKSLVDEYKYILNSLNDINAHKTILDKFLNSISISAAVPDDVLSEEDLNTILNSKNLYAAVLNSLNELAKENSRNDKARNIITYHKYNLAVKKFKANEHFITQMGENNKNDALNKMREVLDSSHILSSTDLLQAIIDTNTINEIEVNLLRNLSIENLEKKRERLGREIETFLETNSDKAFKKIIDILTNAESDVEFNALVNIVEESKKDKSAGYKFLEEKLLNTYKDNYKKITHGAEFYANDVAERYVSEKAPSFLETLSLALIGQFPSSAEKESTVLNNIKNQEIKDLPIYNNTCIQAVGMSYVIDRLNPTDSPKNWKDYRNRTVGALEVLTLKEIKNTNSGLKSSFLDYIEADKTSAATFFKGILRSVSSAIKFCLGMEYKPRNHFQFWQPEGHDFKQTTNEVALDIGKKFNN